MELDESITLVRMSSVCVWQKHLVEFCGKLLAELASFSMIHLLLFKQLGSDLSHQSCLCFQSVHGSK